MKKLIIGLLVSGFIAVSTNLALAEWFAKGQPEKEKAAAPAAAVKKQVNKVQEMITKKKSEINGTEWAIEIKPMSGKGKLEKDTLIFMDAKVGTKNMATKGYAATNFSMRLLEDNETYTWETMQISEKEGTAFWRGDISSDGVMRGVVSIRNKKNIVSDYNFVSAGLKKPSPEVESALVPKVEQAAVKK